MTGQIIQTRRDIVNKLSVLEYVLGFRNYHIFKPSKEFSSKDIISLQKEASRILRFLNMDKYTAIISYSSVERNTAGYLELSEQDDSLNVFITIGSIYKGDDNAVLCIMAHEICHKLLHIHHFRGRTTEENEVYTDLAAIYAGLGKLILNGCFKKEVDKNIQWHSNMMRTTINTTISEIGYLPKEDYAWAFVIMASLYGAGKLFYLKGLKDDIKWLIIGTSAPHLSKVWFNLKINYLNKKYKSILDKIERNSSNPLHNRRALQEVVHKYSYADEVRAHKGFSKPITAYSLLLEPILWKELFGIANNCIISE